MVIDWPSLWSYKRKTCKDLHENQKGIAKSQAEAHNTIYCARHKWQYWQLHLPLQSLHPGRTIPDTWIPNMPGTVIKSLAKIGADIFTWKAKITYLSANTFPKFPSAIPVNSPIIQDHGDSVKPDPVHQGSTQRILYAQWVPLQQWRFAAFAHQWEFAHTNTYPICHQSNRFIEWYVQTWKNASPWHVQHLHWP